MKKEQFLDIINEIDDELISLAKTHTEKRRTRGILKISFFAACLCLVAATVFAVPLLNKKAVKTSDVVTGGKVIPLTTYDFGENEIIHLQIITTFDAEVGSYRSPEAGEVGYTTAVGKAFDEYSGGDVCFLLAFNVFKENEPLSGEELAKEYQRLSDLGLNLYLIEEHWAYGGEGEKLYSPIITALVTEEEVLSLKVNENYGYFFYFAKNGDSSPIIFEGAEAITDFDVPYL